MKYIIYILTALLFLSCSIKDPVSVQSSSLNISIQKGNGNSGDKSMDWPDNFTAQLKISGNNLADKTVSLNIVKHIISLPPDGTGIEKVDTVCTATESVEVPTGTILFLKLTAIIDSVLWQNQEESVTINNTGGTNVVLYLKPPFVAVTSVYVSPAALSVVLGGAAQQLTATVLPLNATNKTVLWSYTDASIAMVNKNGRIIAVSVGETKIIATTADGGKTDTCHVTVTSSPIPVTSVSVSPSTANLIVGGADKQLTATVLPVDASNKTVSWTSSAPAVATVSITGLVTAVSGGNATITATTIDGGKTATCTVIVTNTTEPVTGIKIKDATYILVGASEVLTPSIIPANATNKSVNWLSTDSSIVTVRANGKITGIANGIAQIIATTVDGNFKDTCVVTVSTTAVPVAGIFVSPTTANLSAIGMTQQLKPTIMPAEATNQSVSWDSSDPSVATVSSSGLVTAVSAGNATITVTTLDGGKTATCQVTVILTIAVTSVSVDPTTANLIVGGANQQLTATVLPVDASNKTVSWISSDPNVADVSITGLVTAVSDGNATITVTTIDGGKTATCEITVTMPAVPVINTSLSSLAFGNVPVNTSKDSSFILTGSSLNGIVKITAAIGYQLSKVAGSGFADEISFTPISGSVNAPVFVRFKPTIIQDYPGNITCVSAGATNKNINVTGSGVIAPPMPVMILINGGTFNMGQPNPDIGGTGWSADEQPVHVVTLSSFYIGKYEVTQTEWITTMGTNPSYFNDDLNRPVEGISWYDIIVYCNTRSIAESLTPCYKIKGSTNPDNWGAVPTSANDSTWDAVTCNWSAKGYRLPTEAEWEFASRGGTSSAQYTYSGSNAVGDVAWYDVNSNSTPLTVGLKLPNELGLYDMSGNVFEWNWDRNGSYTATAQTNPTGSSINTNRLLRGGSYFETYYFCRVTFRRNSNPYDRYYNGGLRLARTP